MDEIKKSDASKDEDLHAKAIECDRKWREREQGNHDQQREAVEFYEGRGQWPEEIKKQREADGSPCLTLNLLPQFVNQVINDIRKNCPQIKVRPVDSAADVQTAKMLGGLIRNIEDMSNARQAYETQAQYSTVGGWGVIRVDFRYPEPEAFWPEIVIEGVQQPLDAVCGPYTKPDGSDTSGWTLAKWVDRAEYEKEFGEVDDWESYLRGCPAEWQREGQLRVCEYWYKKPKKTTLLLDPQGKVLNADDLPDEILSIALEQQWESRESDDYDIHRALLDGNKVLKDEKWPGKVYPFAPVIGNELMIDDELVRFGMVYQAIDGQRQYNYQRSAQIGKQALGPKAPWIGPDTAFEGYEDTWGTANTANHAYLPYRGNVAPTRTISDTVTQGEVQAAQMAQQDVQNIIGITNAGLGEADGANEAHKTVLLKRKESDNAVAQYSSNLARAVELVGRILVDLIPRVYTNARYVRIKGDDDKTEVVKLNEQYIDQTNGEMRFFDLSRGKYDIAVSSGVSFDTMREEAAQAMVEITRAFPQAASVIAPALMKMFDFPGADVLAKEFEQMKQKEQGKPQQDPLMIAQQTEQMKVQSQTQIKQATTQADYQLKMQEAQLKREEAQFNADLEIKTLGQKNAMEIAKANEMLQIEVLKKDQTTTIQVLQQEVQQLREVINRIVAPHQIQ